LIAYTSLVELTMEKKGEKNLENYITENAGYDER